MSTLQNVAIPRGLSCLSLWETFILLMIKPEILAYFGSTSSIATHLPVVDLYQTGEKDCKGAHVIGVHERVVGWGFPVLHICNHPKYPLRALYLSKESTIRATHHW